MAFEETFNLIKNTRKNMVATEEGVSEAQSAYDEIDRQVKNAQARYRRKVGNEHAEVLARDVIKTLKAGNFLETLLIEEIDLAAEGTEFDSDFYKSKLYQVANSKDIYNLVTIGTGWNTHLATLITFEEEGGRLEDYARGIRAYRASLNIKIGPADSNRGLKATNWWFVNVYKTSLEEATVDGRIGVSGRPAPFWKLLDSGSQPMPSDRPDNTYNPVPQSPTGFIIKSEIKINREFDSLFRKVKEIEMAEAEQLQKDIDEAKSVRGSMKEDLKQLTTDFQRNQKVLQSLGAKSAYVDTAKLAKRIRQIDEQEKLPSRVNIGQSGRNLTISVKKLEGLLYD